MEQQDKTAQAEALMAGMLQTINDQTEYMFSVVRMVDWMKQYIRGTLMMAKVCLAGTSADSEAELDLTALSQFLADVETWLGMQDQVIRERFEWLALVNATLQAMDKQPPAADFQPQESAEIPAQA